MYNTEASENDGTEGKSQESANGVCSLLLCTAAKGQPSQLQQHFSEHECTKPPANAKEAQTCFKLCRHMRE